MLYYKDKMYWYVMYSLPWQISYSCIQISQNRSGASSPLHLVAPQTGLLWTVVKPRNLINLSLDVTMKASNDTCCCCSIHVTFSLTKSCFRRCLQSDHLQQMSIHSIAKGLTFCKWHTFWLACWRHDWIFYKYLCGNFYLAYHQEFIIRRESIANIPL